MLAFFCRIQQIVIYINIIIFLLDVVGVMTQARSDTRISRDKRAESEVFRLKVHSIHLLIIF